MIRIPQPLRVCGGCSAWVNWSRLRRGVFRRSARVRISPISPGLSLSGACEHRLERTGIDRARKAKHLGAFPARLLESRLPGSSFVYWPSRSSARGGGASFRCRNGARCSPARPRLVATSQIRVSLPLHARRVRGVLPQGAPRSLKRKGLWEGVYIGIAETKLFPQALVTASNAEAIPNRAARVH